MNDAPSKEDGLRAAQRLKALFLQKGYPVEQILLYGSVARDSARIWSDIDIAVLCKPFLANKHEENVRFLLDSKEVDLRIETVCLHPEDLENKYFGLAQEVKKTGIEA